jgi:hypothetical protein
MIIGYLSPSKIHFANGCKLRYALTLTDTSQKGPKVFNKNTFLGILMHSVLEHYLKLECSVNDYESLWEELFSKMMNDYNVDIRDVEIIKYHLPYYEVKKNKLLILLKTKKFKIDGFELFLEKEIKGGIVRGTADIILENRKDKKVRIIDFKTGPIATYENAEKQTIKTGYSFQLITYGYVYWRDGYRAEDIICALQGPSQNEYEEVVFTQEQYENQEKLLFNIKSEINLSVKESNTDSLANPDPMTCKYCDYCSSCASLHNSMDLGTNYPSLTLVRQINSEFDDVETKINIITNGGQVSIYKMPRDVYRSIKQLIKVGKSVFINGLYEQHNANIKYWTRYTKFCAINKY